MGSSKFLLFFYSVILSLAMLTLSLNDTYYEYSCSQTGGNYTANSTYQANLNRIVSQFSLLLEFNYGFFNLSEGEGPDRVYTSALCRGDLNQDECNKCLNYTATNLKQLCPSNKAATAWSELCLVRYANQNMYGLLENDPRDCAFNPTNASDHDQFNRALTQLLANLRGEAANRGLLLKYAVGDAKVDNMQKLYAMVQCTPDMDEENCSQCLTDVMDELGKCCPISLGCRVFRPTCILRFENGTFFNQTVVPLPSSSPPPGKSDRS